MGYLAPWTQAVGKRSTPPRRVNSPERSGGRCGAKVCANKERRAVETAARAMNGARNADDRPGGAQGAAKPRQVNITHRREPNP